VTSNNSDYLKYWKTDKRILWFQIGGVLNIRGHFTGTSAGQGLMGLKQVEGAVETQLQRVESS
jgi:hypothetical protein